MVSPADGRTLWAFLMSSAALAQVLEQRTGWGGQVSAPLLAMGTGMLLSASGIIPATAPAYDWVWSTAMPHAVALTLLETDVRRTVTESGPVLTAFWFGAAATILGTILAFALVGRSLGPEGWKMGACLCASYIGGNINYAATAQALGLGATGMLAAGMAADNLLMAGYFAAIMALAGGRRDGAALPPAPPGEAAPTEDPPTEVTVESAAVAVAAASVACGLARALTRCLPPAFAGAELGATAVLASGASALVASVSSRGGGGGKSGRPASEKVPLFAGAEAMGGALMLVFFSVVGATAGVREALVAGWRVLAFGSILLLTHLAVILALGRAAKLPTNAVLVASNANVGGPATAAAMATARNWPHLVRMALLVGTLGYTVGTAIGCVVGLKVLKPMAASLLRVA